LFSARIIFVGGKYYAVSDGVWFVSENAQGPWVVADNVPSDVYSIPPSSPVYHVKYVYVYDSTPDRFSEMGALAKRNGSTSIVCCTQNGVL